MEISKTECKRILRTLELKAYRSVVDALRAQGTFTNNKHEVLKNLAATLSISEERYRSEMRRASNDDLLNAIAQSISGKNTEAEWRAESKKKVPLTPIVASQTAFTALADTISDIVALENEKFSGSAGLSNVIESYKCRSEKNLEKYNSSKVLDSLLKKRKNHHQDAILSEIQKIKSNNNYHQSPVKGYIEVSYDEEPNITETPAQNYNHKSVSWKSDDEVYTVDDGDYPSKSTPYKLPKKSDPKRVKSNTKEIEHKSQPEGKNNQKSKLKKKVDQKPNIEDKPVNSSILQNSGETRNLRTKPFKKYTLDSVEIRSFVDEEPPEEPKPKVKSKPANDVSKKFENAQPVRELNTNDHIEISSNEKSSKTKSKASKRKSKVKTKPTRPSKLINVRKHGGTQRMKVDTAMEGPTRISRISMRNARRRNYAKMASGDYDLFEFRRVKKVKTVEPDPEPEPEPQPEPEPEVEEVEDEISEEEDVEEEEDKETDPDTHSDSSNAPIEVSYSNPTLPKTSNFELEPISAHFTEDDMKPHTFNLIPASRRLKMLKKRALSPTTEEIPAKKPTLSPPKNEPNPIANKTTPNDINALRKVLAAHENMGIVATCSINDLPENVKELLDISDNSQSSLPCSRDSTEVKSNSIPAPIASFPVTSTQTPLRVTTEKRPVKAKVKLSAMSSIECLNSIISRVKEMRECDREPGKEKRPTLPSMIRKPLVNKVTKKIPQARIPPSIETKGNGTLIEVNNLEHGSDSSSSLNDVNYDASSKDSDSEDQIIIESNEEPKNVKPPKPTSEELEEISNDEEVVSITLEDVEDIAGCDVSEQLIDIESADIIISDSGDQNGGFIIAENNAAVIATEPSEEINGKDFENVKLLEPSTVKISSDEPKSIQDDIIIINMDKSENVSAEKHVNSSDPRDENTKTTTTNHLQSQTIVKEMSSAASDFRYIADADDPSLNKTPVPPKPPTPSANSVSGPAKLSTVNTTAPIIINSLEAVTSQKSSLNKPKVIFNESTKDRQFVLLDTNVTAGSKSLLKSMKTLPKFSPASAPNNSAQKPKKLAIYSSLKNINMATFSSFSKHTAVKTTNVTSLLKNDDFSTDANSISDNVNSKTTSVQDLNRVLSEALESSIKLIDGSKNKEKLNPEMNVAFGESPSNDYNKMFEISSNNSLTGDSISNNNENDSLADIGELKTFFSKNIIKKQS